MTEAIIVLGGYPEIAPDIFEERRERAEAIAAQHDTNYADPEIHPADAFDLPAIFDELGIEPGRCQFMVFFTSIRKENADEELLTKIDTAAHEEAVNMPGGGLNFYYRGPKVSFLSFDGTLTRNAARSTCAWDTEWQAHQALFGPRHMEAVKIAPDMYENFRPEYFWAFRALDGSVDLVRLNELNEDQTARVAELNQQAKERTERILAELATKNTVTVL